jgi:hypothetical protein
VMVILPPLQMHSSSMVRQYVRQCMVPPAMHVVPLSLQRHLVLLSAVTCSISKLNNTAPDCCMREWFQYMPTCN